jgi:hypothetical protein
MSNFYHVTVDFLSTAATHPVGPLLCGDAQSADGFHSSESVLGVIHPLARKDHVTKQQCPHDFRLRALYAGWCGVRG